MLVINDVESRLLAELERSATVQADDLGGRREWLLGERLEQPSGILDEDARSGAAGRFEQRSLHHRSAAI